MTASKGVALSKLLVAPAPTLTTLPASSVRLYTPARCPSNRTAGSATPTIRRSGDAHKTPPLSSRKLTGGAVARGLVLGDRDVDRLLGLDVDEAAAVAKHVPEVGRGDGGVPWWDFDLSL